MRPLFLFLALAACGGAASPQPTPSPQPPPSAAPIARDAPGDPPDTSWCTTTGPHALCADFDLGARPNGWEFFDGDDKNNRDLYDYTTAGRSGYAFHVAGPALDAKAGGTDPSDTYVFDGSVVDARAPKTTATKAHLAFDIRIDRADDPLQPVQLTARTATQTIAYDVWFVVDATSTNVLATFDGGSAGPGFPPIARNRWVHVRIDVDDQKGTASLSFDGAAVGTVPFNGKLADSVETTLYVGVTRTPPSGAYDVSYDQVTLDFE